MDKFEFLTGDGYNVAGRCQTIPSKQGSIYAFNMQLYHGVLARIVKFANTCGTKLQYLCELNSFSSDFVFQLTKDEVEMMVSHFAIPSKQSLGGYLTYVFIE